MKYFFSIIIFSTVCFSTAFGQSTAVEKEAKVIQFTGVILDSDSGAIPGVHIYTPIYGRGTTTNIYGFFSMPALEGDSLIISAVGFKKSRYVVPAIKTQTLKVIFKLEADTTQLQEVRVYNMPPTAEAFKQAVLAMQLPTEYNNMTNNLSPATLHELMERLPADGSSNHMWFTQQQANYQRTRNSVPINPLLNPMAWVELFRSIKRGDFKNDD